MKLQADPWTNRWRSFYMELHGTVSWNHMENVLIVHGKYQWRNSMEFHGNWCPNPPWNSMATFSVESHGKCPNPPWRYFPWKSMEKFSWNSIEIDVLILHGI